MYPGRLSLRHLVCFLFNYVWIRLSSKQHPCFSPAASYGAFAQISSGVGWSGIGVFGFRKGSGSCCCGCRSSFCNRREDGLPLSWCAGWLGGFKPLAFGFSENEGTTIYFKGTPKRFIRQHLGHAPATRTRHLRHSLVRSPLWAPRGCSQVAAEGRENGKGTRPRGLPFARKWLWCKTTRPESFGFDKCFCLEFGGLTAGLPI